MTGLDGSFFDVTDVTSEAAPIDPGSTGAVDQSVTTTDNQVQSPQSFADQLQGYAQSGESLLNAFGGAKNAYNSLVTNPGGNSSATKPAATNSIFAAGKTNWVIIAVIAFIGFLAIGMSGSKRRKL